VATTLGARGKVWASYREAADLVLRNGVIVTIDELTPLGEALAIRNKRIMAVGDNGQIDKLVDGSTRVIDLAGKMLAGIDRYLTRELANCAEQRAASWKPDTQSPEAYERWLAPRRERLALGGSLRNAVVVDDFHVLNPDGLRFPDEFVRHKILDLIGDLYLLGLPIRGRITANMTSHGYNQALVQRLYQAIQSSTGRALDCFSGR
jgi:hypothetical protein